MEIIQASIRKWWRFHGSGGSFYGSVKISMEVSEEVSLCLWYAAVRYGSADIWQFRILRDFVICVEALFDTFLRSV